MATTAGPKQKKTHVVRYYGEENTDSEDFWVDVETLDRITFNGRQGNVSNKNQAQETTVNLADFAKDPGRKLFTVRVFNPQDDNQYIDVDINGTIEVNTRSKFQYQKTGRWFDTSIDNKSRKFLPLRIINNNIDDQYLTEVTDLKETAAEKTAREEAESHTGQKTGTVANITGHNTGRKTKQPPTDPDQYLKAVQKTNDKNEDVHLSVQLIDTFGISRANRAQHQAVEFNGMWNNCLLYKPEGKTDDRATQAKIDGLTEQYKAGKINQDKLNEGLDAIQADRILPGVEEDPQAGGVDPVRLDPLQVVVNFGGTKPLAFLYSGNDGMFGSKDGKKWEKAPASVAANSLAWIDDVWVGCNPDSGCWRSEDGAKTWDSIEGVPNFTEVAAMRPAGKGKDGKPLPGIFAGWLVDYDADEFHVYTSQDLGETWDKVLAVSQVVPYGDGADGYHVANALSGCGGAFFLGTQRGETRYANGSGMMYVSIDGRSFSGPTMVFGPGTNNLPDEVAVLQKGYAASYVAFDEKTKMYSCFGFSQIQPAVGFSKYSIIYTRSSGPSFGSGDGTILASELIDATGTAGFIGNALSGPYNAAGGDGTFATGGQIIHDFFSAGAESSIDLVAYLGSKSQKLVTGIFAHGLIGSFCFKTGGTATESTQSSSSKPTKIPPGMFACIAVDLPFEGKGGAGGGGVFVTQSDGSFVKTHAGSPLAVAVGKLGFPLGKKEEAK